MVVCLCGATDTVRVMVCLCGATDTVRVMVCLCGTTAQSVWWCVCVVLQTQCDGVSVWCYRLSVMVCMSGATDTVRVG